MQYYVAGRSAAIAQLIPVLGNLLHHAIDMSLKAALAKHKTLRELEKMSHDLTNIWAQFKAQYPTQEAARFDDAIVQLQKFEELRYPDSVLTRGAMMKLVLFREHVGTPSASAIAVPQYVLVLEDIDELMAFTFRLSDLNPPAFIGSMGPEGSRYLFMHNRMSKVWE